MMNRRAFFIGASAAAAAVVAGVGLGAGTEAAELADAQYIADQMRVPDWFRPAMVDDGTIVRCYLYESDCPAAAFAFEKSPYFDETEMREHLRVAVWRAKQMAKLRAAGLI